MRCEDPQCQTETLECLKDVPHFFCKRLLNTLLYENFILCSQEKNMVMFYDNDTKVRGVCGEMWYLLADYLNFTYVTNNTISYIVSFIRAAELIA